MILLLTAAVAGARLEVRVFARVPAPGYPANAVRASDGTVYAGTFKSFSSPSDTGPSKVFGFSPAGRLERTYTVEGQTRGAPDAVQVATIDRAGILYLLDQDPARIIKLDPRTGRQSTWGTFRSLPACGPGVAGECSAGMGGNPPEPDFAAWGPDGSLYVTDYSQALIWRVPPGGGTARVWLTDSSLNGVVVGPAGIQLMADGHTLLVSTGGGGLNPSTGKLYTLPILPNGRPGALQQIWESATAEAPDGLAIARSGDIYVALVGPSGNAVVEVSPSGRLIARIPSDNAANNKLAVPFDAPGSVTFDGTNLLVTNQASIDNDSSHWAILEIAAGEPGLPVSLPPGAAPPTPRRYARAHFLLLATPRRARAGHRARVSFRAFRVVGRIRRPLVGAQVRFAGAVRRTGRAGGASFRVVLRQAGRRYRATLWVGGHRVAEAVLTVTGGRRGRLESPRPNVPGD